MLRFKFNLVKALAGLTLISLALASPGAYSAEQCESDELSNREKKLLAWCERRAGAFWNLREFRKWKRHFCDELFGNEPPVVDVQPTNPVQEHSYITLDASSSYDPDSDALTFNWTQIAGTNAILASDSNTATPTFYISKGSAGEQLVFEVAVSDGEEAVSEQVAVDVATCAEDTDGVIFTNCISPAWNGITGWEMLNDGSNQNYHYENGHNDNLVQWQITPSEDESRGQVIDIRYSDRSDVNGFARIFTAGGIGATTDFSRFSNGSLEFDMQVLDWGDSAGTFYLKLECIYPCESAWFILDFNGLNEWKHFSIPASVLAESGLDLSNLEMGFQVFPEWNQQANAHFQVDNIAWLPGEPPVDNEPETLVLEPGDWSVYSSVGVSNPEYFVDDAGLSLSPNWESADAVVSFVQFFDPAVNLDGAEITLDVYVPQAATETSGTLTLFAFDSNWNAAFHQGMPLSEFVGDAWNTITIPTFENGHWDIGSVDFNPSDIISLDFLISANGSSTNPGQFIINNAQIQLGLDNGNPDSGGGTQPIALNPDSWSTSDVNGSPTIDWVPTDNAGIFFYRLVGETDDNRMYINYLDNTVDLRGGELIAFLQVPEELAGKAFVMQTFLLDSDYRYATPGGTNLANFDGETGLDWTLYDINASTFSYMDAGFDLGAISAVGVQLMFFEDLNIEVTQLGVYDIALVPGDGSTTEPGYGDASSFSFNFEGPGDISSWYFTTPNLSLYLTSDWQGLGAMGISPAWQTDGDIFQLFSYLPNILNLNSGTLDISYQMPASYADNSQLQIRPYIEDVSGFRGFAQAIDYNSVGANDDGKSTRYALELYNLEYPDNFDITQIAVVGLEFNANGKPIDIVGDIILSDITVTEYQE